MILLVFMSFTSQLDHVVLDIRIVVGQGLDAVGIEALGADPGLHVFHSIVGIFAEGGHDLLFL
jgi:hypothetical protein